MPGYIIDSDANGNTFTHMRLTFLGTEVDIISTTFLEENVEKIVRCKNCKFYEPGIKYPPICNRVNPTQVKPDGFCSWGERSGD